jgi:ABC-type glycerol-3-phosphate transport system permease component
MLTEIADSARGLVDAMSDIVWSIDPERDDLRNVSTRIRQFASEVLEARGINWELDLPRELEESAWVDGASRYAAFRHVVLPLIRPGLVAASILSLQLAWNDFLFSAVLTNNATRTLPVLMAGFSGGDTGVDWGGMTASGALVILPVLIFSFAAQRHLVAGLSSGAVKG